MSHETLRERLGKVLVGPKYDPKKNILPQLREQLRAPKVEKPPIELTKEEEEVLREEYGWRASEILEEMSPEEKKKAAREILEERARPFERPTLAVEFVDVKWPR